MCCETKRAGASPHIAERGAGLTALALLALSIAGCGEADAPPEAVIRPIEWVKVETFGLDQVRRLSGLVQSVETARLSFEVSGKVAEAPAKLGDRVQSGQLLAKLETESFQLNIDAARGQLRDATAALNEAQSDFDRKKSLFENGWVAQSVLDNAERGLDSARSAVDVAVAELDLTQKALRDAELRAPYRGVITAREIEPSQQVSAGQVAFEIEGEGGFEIVVAVPETLIDKVERLQTFEASFPAARQIEMTARVTEVGSRAESANTYPVTLLLERAEPALRAGMTAEIDFVFAGEGRTGYTGETARIPIAAVAAGSGQDDAYVFVFDEAEGVVRQRPVQTENIIGNDVLISDGLAPGDIVAAGGVTFLRDGQKVKLLDRSIQQFN